MYFGVDYYPEHWVFPYAGTAEEPEARWKRDIELMVEAGVNVVRWEYAKNAHDGYEYDDISLYSSSSGDRAWYTGTYVDAEDAGYLLIEIVERSAMLSEDDDFALSSGSVMHFGIVLEDF